MKSLIKQLLRENLLLEGEVFPYKLVSRNDFSEDYLEFKFEFTANGLEYGVVIKHYQTKSNFGEFDLSFHMKGQTYTADRAGLDLKHYNSVINTVTQIADETVKKYKIRQIKIEGARDDYDTNNYVNPTLRAKLYLRQILRIYPSDAVTSFGKNIKIDMTKVYPELFDDLTKLNTIIDLTTQISDESDITNDFTKTSNYIGGINDNHFDINHANVLNSKLGEISIAVTVNSKLKQYSIEWRSYDTNKEQSEYFNNFKTLVNYMKETFLTPEQTNEGDKMLNAITNKLEGLSYTVKPFKTNVHRDLIKRYDVPEDMVYLKYFEDDGQFDIFFTFDNHDYFISYFEGSSYLLEILDEGTSKLRASKEFKNFDDLLRYI